jgi:hypothetical protein
MKLSAILNKSHMVAISMHLNKLDIVNRYIGLEGI